jgi:hypothetical protein
VDHYATAPARIRDWVGALPEYEPKQVHDWEDAPFDLEYGERRDVKCKNCDATYEQRRLSWDEMRGLK